MQPVAVPLTLIPCVLRPAQRGLHGAKPAVPPDGCVCWISKQGVCVEGGGRGGGVLDVSTVICRGYVISVTETAILNCTKYLQKSVSAI
jgi:hypothetical protein